MPWFPTDFVGNTLRIWIHATDCVLTVDIILKVDFYAIQFIFTMFTCLMRDFGANLYVQVRKLPAYEIRNTGCVIRMKEVIFKNEGFRDI